MTKKQLRQLYTAKRQQLSVSEYADLNKRLLQQFRQLDLAQIHCIHLFLTALERKEPDTYLIRDWLKAEHPPIIRVFPKANFADHTMQSYADDEQLQLEVNGMGITEPIYGNLIDDKQIDAILVPLLAFDRQGYRVGYGKGFYDRFIARCRPDVQLIGFSLFDPVERIDDLHEFDLPLEQCITPNKIWVFPKGN